METKKIGRPQGRPRRFDVEAALALGQAMFHERGYDAVGLAALTERLDIRPPSFYAAFGSKAGFFERVLERYTAAVLPLEAILRPGRPPAEAMTELLESAARSYAADPATRGCLVLETSRSCADEESTALAPVLCITRHASSDASRRLLTSTRSCPQDPQFYAQSKRNGRPDGATHPPPHRSAGSGASLYRRTFRSPTKVRGMETSR